MNVHAARVVASPEETPNHGGSRPLWDSFCCKAAARSVFWLEGVRFVSVKKLSRSLSRKLQGQLSSKTSLSG